METSPKPGRRTRKPRGRKAPDDTLILVFKRLASRRIKVVQNGRRRTMTVAEAIIAKNYEAALQNNPTAIANILRLAEQAGEFIDTTNPDVVGKPLFMPRKCSTVELMAEQGSKRVYLPSTPIR